MQPRLIQHICNHGDVYSILCILAVCILFLSPYLFSSPTPLIYPVSELGTDLDRDVLPNLEYIANAFQTTGELPLWRDYLLSGAPLMGHPSLPLFYPPNWLLLALPLPFGLNLLAVLDFSWMGIGMYLFLRRTAGRDVLPALFGGIAMMLSPKWIAHLSGGHWYMLAALAWVPWALFTFDCYWHSRKIPWLFVLAIAFAAQGMNHLPIFIITALSVALFSLTYFAPKSWRAWVAKSAPGWAAVVLLTAGLLAAQMLPLLELYPHASHTTEAVTFTSLNPAALLVSIFPPELKYPEWFLFPGLAVLLFAGLSWAYGWTLFEKNWVIGGLLGLLLSLGEYTPLYGWLFGWNPLLSALRVPTRWWLLTILALVILAAAGFAGWLRNGQRLNRRAKTVAGALLGLELLAGTIRLTLRETFPFDTLSTAIFALLLAALLIAGHAHRPAFVPAAVLLVLVVELMVVGGSLIRPRPTGDSGVSASVIAKAQSELAEGERIYSPQEGFPALALVRSGIDAAEGYDALPLTHYLGFIRLATGCPLVQEATGSEEELAACLNPQVVRPDLLKLLNVRRLVVRQADGWQVSELAPGFGRAFAAAQVESTSAQSCLAALAGVDAGEVSLVEGGKTGPGGQLRVDSQDRGVNAETFRVHVLDAPVLLIRSESWAPGWHVSVDGQDADVLRVDCALQGVWLEPGEHTVVFRYQPFGYPIGGWISACTLASIGLWAGANMFFKRKPSQAG